MGWSLKIKSGSGTAGNTADRMSAVPGADRMSVVPGVNCLFRSSAFSTALVFLVLILSTGLCVAQTKRLVLIKVDGLPYGIVDRAVKERDPITGKSALPWFDYIYYQRGSRLANFYVRGMSLSAPSW